MAITAQSLKQLQEVAEALVNNNNIIVEVDG